MSKNVAMFVDVANMYYAARGQDVDVDYVALLKHATKGRDLIRAYAYTGLDPENENQRKFIDFLAKNGYKPVVKDIRKFGDGRMKANLDIELVVDLFRLADRMDIAVIVSGDGDFAPAIRALQDKGVRAEVISFKPNTSSDLIAVADEFTDIMKIASISRKEGRAIRDTGMSAPEMPAKEVTPEFGFREASPSVAAAALAALRGGTSESPRRARGGTGRRAGAAASPAAELPEERTTAVVAMPEASDVEQEARRRRRRRGGRGRGRTRRDELPEAATAGAEEEIGWQEFDDLSQLDGLADEREYTFEEADAATLAELGLTPEEAAVQEAPTEGSAETAEAAPKPRRRGRAAKVDDAEVAAQADEPAKPRRRSRAKPVEATAEAAEPTEEAPTRRRRPRTSATEERDQPVQTTQAAAAEDAPKPRRRASRAKAGAAPDSGEGAAESAEPAPGEPQGIWGRFRSARRPRTGSSSER